MWLGNLDEVVKDLTLSAETMDLVAEFNKQANAYGALMLILGIMQTIGAVGILAHRAWGRAFGVVLGLLGTILGIGLLVSSVDLNLGDQAIKGTFSDETGGVRPRHPRVRQLCLHLPGHVRGQASLPEEGRQLIDRLPTAASTTPGTTGGRPLSTADRGRAPGVAAPGILHLTPARPLGQSRRPVDHSDHGS